MGSMVPANTGCSVLYNDDKNGGGGIIFIDWSLNASTLGERKGIQPMKKFVPVISKGSLSERVDEED